MDYVNKSKELRRDIIQMIYEAKSGHPGGSFSVLEILMAIYYNIRANEKDNEKCKVILSKGHACPALYAILADIGYIKKDDLWTLRKIGSKLQGHPDYKKTPGVDICTGSLGQGTSVSVGIALAEKYKKSKIKIFNIMGDGECQEGIVWEAAMAASHYMLNNLTFILDYNKLQIDGTNDEVMKISDIKNKFSAFGFECFDVDGHNIDEITNVLQKETTKPKFVCANTIKGKGVSFMENNVGWHGKAPSKEEYEKAIAELS